MRKQDGDSSDDDMPDLEWASSTSEGEITEGHVDPEGSQAPGDWPHHPIDRVRDQLGRDHVGDRTNPEGFETLGIRAISTEGQAQVRCVSVYMCFGGSDSSKTVERYIRQYLRRAPGPPPELVEGPPQNGGFDMVVESVNRGNFNHVAFWAEFGHKPRELN
jgi:hypothetical protein